MITVPERGSAEITTEQWALLSGDVNFWRLVEANILQVETASSGKWRLKGTCYVGRALFGQTVLEVAEKFSGAFETLVGLGALKAPKIAQAPSPVAKSTGSTAVLISLFIRAVRAYLGGLKKVAYVRVRDAGTIAGGRLDVLRTIRLRTRGLAHQIAFDRSVLTADLPFNRCIYAALSEVERLSRVTQLQSDDIASARALRATLSECLPSVLKARPGELARIAASETRAAHSRVEVADVISLAGAVLDAAGFGGVESWQRQIQRSWFVNLETFFEEAIRVVVGEILGPTFTVRAARDRPRLFSDVSERYRANPDIVISSAESQIAAIGDAKYKEFEGWPGVADVHELIAHAAAYHASKALLFYPSEAGFVHRSFGASATGCAVWAFGLRFTDLVFDIRRSLSMAGLLDDPSENN